MTIEYGPDVYEGNWSYYKNYPWKMYNDGGSRVMVMKATMGYGDSSEPYLTDCFNYHKEAGFKIGFYGWADPTAQLPQQLLRFESLVNRFHPDFVAMDMEQYWQQWSQYWKWLNGEISDSQVDKFAPTFLNSFYEAYYNGIKQFGLLALCYTAKWFVQGYVRPAGLLSLFTRKDIMPSADRVLSNMPAYHGLVDTSKAITEKLPQSWPGLDVVNPEWMSTVNLWEGLYYDQNRARISTNWTDFKIQMDAVPWNGVGTIPHMPANKVVWQIGSRWKADGIGGNLDMNKFCPEFVSLIENPNPPLPPPPPPPVNTKLITLKAGVRLRKKPGITEPIITDMPLGNELVITGEDEVHKDGYYWVPIRGWVARVSDIPGSDPLARLEP